MVHTGPCLSTRLGMGTIPSNSLHASAEVMRLLMRSSAEDEERFASSTATYSQAVRAAARVGWKLEAISYRPVKPSSRQVSPFMWPDTEDDSKSKDLVQRELEENLDIPSGFVLMAIERRILVDVTAEVDNKRTHLTAKTDFAIVLREAAEDARIALTCMVHCIAMLWETKTSAALAKSMGRYRGGAAGGCLAVNLRVLEMGKLAAGDEGVPVVLTDLSSFRCFLVPDVGQGTIVEIEHADKACAYDELSQVVQRQGGLAAQRGLRRSVACDVGSQSVAAGGETSRLNGEGDAGMDDLEDDLDLGMQNICQAVCPLVSGRGEYEGVEVYVEDLGHAIARALAPDAERAPEPVMRRVPDYVVHLYV